MVNQQAVTIESVRQFAEEVKKQGVKLRQVFLFGSYARGGAREWSDVDVALVADEFVGVSFEDIKRFIDVTPFKSPTSFLNCTPSIPPILNEATPLWRRSNGRG